MGGYTCLDDISVPSGCALWNSLGILFVGNYKMAEVDV